MQGKEPLKAIRIARKAISSTRGPIARILGLRSQSNDPAAKQDFSFSQHASGQGLNLAIMSFNIRRGTAHDRRNHWTYRRNLVYKILNQYHPNVLGLQEALDFQISEIGAMLPGYEWVGIGNRGGSKGLHNAIFFDARLFELIDGGTFWMSDTPHIPGSKGWGNIIPRICTWTRLIDRESRQAFYFYNAHLDHLSRRSQKNSVISLIRAIQARSSPDPFVLAGDFNSRERSMPIQYLKGKTPLTTKEKAKVTSPVPLTDTFRACYPRHRNIATFHGFRDYFFRFRLDYIFVPASIQILDAEIIQWRWDKRYPSDHFPLITHICLPETLSLSNPSSSIEETP